MKNLYKLQVYKLLKFRKTPGFSNTEQAVWCRMAKLLQNQVKGVVFSFLWRLERRSGKLGNLTIPGVYT